MRTRSHRGRDLTNWFTPVAVFILVLPYSVKGAARQADTEVSPEAVPEIRQVKPGQAAAGDEVTVIIEGKNFSPGVYVSFSTPSVHATSTRRVSSTQLEARVAVGMKAESGAIRLYVSNPASAVAETFFTVTGGITAATPSAPAADPVATPPAQANSLIPTPAAPAAAVATSTQPSAAPEVTKVDPPRAGKGSRLQLKIHGKNFDKGAKVAFSNSGIRVLETEVKKDTELTARVQIADDAATGSSGLFVVNPDDNETEAAFVVTDEAPTNTAPAASTSEPPASRKSDTKTEKAAAESLLFDVISLADVAGILQKGSRPKGTLKFADGKLRFEESGNEVFTASAAEIKEVGANMFLGVNTGTFHIILNSGKTYNFIAASLKPADSESIIDSLRKALK
ncbi:MAG: hypothetical protein ACE145_06915 [Terriglobia bacterium]